MAKSANNSLGGLIGAIVCVVVVGAIAGSGFYLGYLQTDSQKTDMAVGEPAERLRRVVLGLNEELTAIGDAYASAVEDAGIGDKTVEEILSKKTDVLNKDAAESLNQTTQILTKVQSEDAGRGTVLEGKSIVSGKPDIQKEMRKLRVRYQNRNKDLYQEADAAIAELNKAGPGNLEADRIKAIYYLARGRVEANRAAFEQLASGWEGQHAICLAPVVAELNRDLSVIQSAAPAKAIAETEKLIASGEKEIATLQAQSNDLTKAITDKETKLGELVSTAQEARKKLAQLEASGAAIQDENGEYAKLAQSARRAEADAEALRNGTLAGATIKLNEADDLLTSPYEGGQPETGVRDLKTALASQTEEVKIRQAAVAGLQREREGLQKRSQELQDRQKEVEDTLATQVAAIREHLDAATKSIMNADAASKLAVASYAQAEKSAKTAASAASTRTREARSAGSAVAAGPEAERFALIAADGDTEASLQCLLAEINYHTAMLRARQIFALQEANRAASFVAHLSGGEDAAKVDAQLEPMRTEALEKLAAANKAYEEAAKLIRGTSLKTEGASAQGKDYEWQVQVGQAAVHLLQGQLSSQPEEALAQRNASYELLKTAAQGREQSPLLAPALDMLVYLQKTAK